MGWLKNSNEQKRARIRHIYHLVEAAYPDEILMTDVEAWVGTIGHGTLARLLERLVAHGYIYSQWAASDQMSRPRCYLLLNPQHSSADLEYAIRGVKIVSWTVGWR